MHSEQDNPDTFIDQKPKTAIQSKRVLKFGAIGVTALLLIVGGTFFFNEMRISNLINEVRLSIAGGNIESADSAIAQLEAEERLSGSPELEELQNQLNVLKESKSNFDLGTASFESKEFKDAYFYFSQVEEMDSLRYEEAQVLYAKSVDAYLEERLRAGTALLGNNDLGAYKLSTEVLSDFPDADEFIELRDDAGLGYADNAKLRAEGMISRGFYISAFILVEEVKQLLGNDSEASRSLTTWFNPILNNAKESALENDMAVRSDSFTGSTSYYYKGTYRTCCGGALQAANRFNLYISGKSNPQLRLNVMLYQDDWVFAETIQANIDGTIWTIVTDSYSGESIERDNAYGSIWEYTYRTASKSDISYLLMARESQRTVVRFQGDQDRADFTVSGVMKLGIEKILLAYLALGGSPSVILD